PFVPARLLASSRFNLQVWSEKATVGGILRPVREEFGIPFLAVHGFGSATTVHESAVESQDETRHTLIRYVGDPDPSGMYRSEVDLPQRFEKSGGSLTSERIALAEQQSR